MGVRGFAGMPVSRCAGVHVGFVYITSCALGVCSFQVLYANMNAAAMLKFEKLVREALGHMSFGEYLLNSHSRAGSALFVSRLGEVQRSAVKLCDKNLQMDRQEGVKKAIKQLQELVTDMEQDGGYIRLFTDELSAARVCLVNTLSLFPEYGATN